MCIPRINSLTWKYTYLWEIELIDWSDAKFPTKAKVLWSEWDGVYCLAESAKSIDEYTQLLFPGIATTCFEEMSYSTYVDQMKG